MATVIEISKIPGESAAQSVDFTPVLLSGETVSSGSVTITTDPVGGATTGMVTFTGVTVSEVRFDLGGGASSTRYLIDVLAELNTGDTIGQRLRLTVL